MTVQGINFQLKNNMFNILGVFVTPVFLLIVAVAVLKLFIASHIL